MSPPRPPLRLPPDLASEPVPSRAGTVLYVATLVLIAVWDLGGRSILHRDLPRFAVIAREMIMGGDWLVPQQHGKPYLNKPILFIWMVAGPSALVGDANAVLLRLPSALALVVTGLSTCAWARARTGSLAIGRVAGLFVVTMFLTSELGRTGRPDMLAAACSTACAACLDRAALGRGTRRDPWWAGLALGAGLLSKGPVVMLVPAAVLLLPTPGTTLRGRLGAARPWLVFLVGLAVAALWVVPAWQRAGDGFFQGLVVRQVSERVAGRGNHQEAWWYYLLELPPVLAPWGLLGTAVALGALHPRVRRAVGGTIPAVVGVTMLVLSAVPTKEVRYAAVVAGPLAILAAQAAVGVVRRAADPRAASRHLAGLGVAALLFGLGCVGAMVRWPATAWRLAPVALVAAGTGVVAVARARRGGEAAPVLAGRALGAAVVLVACATLAYWVVLGRYTVIRSVEENRQVARVLPEGVPVAIVMGERLEPDDLFEAVARPMPVPTPSDVPTAETHPRLVVVCIESALDAVSFVRGEAPRVFLRWPHVGGGTLVVAAYGPRVPAPPIAPPTAPPTVPPTEAPDGAMGGFRR